MPGVRRSQRVGHTERPFWPLRWFRGALRRSTRGLHCRHGFSVRSSGARCDILDDQQTFLTNREEHAAFLSLSIERVTCSDRFPAASRWSRLTATHIACFLIRASGRHGFFSKGCEAMRTLSGRTRKSLLLQASIWSKFPQAFTHPSPAKLADKACDFRPTLLASAVTKLFINLAVMGYSRQENGDHRIQRDQPISFQRVCERR